MIGSKSGHALFLSANLFYGHTEVVSLNYSHSFVKLYALMMLTENFLPLLSPVRLLTAYYRKKLIEQKFKTLYLTIYILLSYIVGVIHAQAADTIRSGLRLDGLCRPEGVKK